MAKCMNGLFFFKSSYCLTKKTLYIFYRMTTINIFASSAESVGKKHHCGKINICDDERIW